MEIAALASGSSGNCFFIQNGNSAVLVDAGISSKQIEERLDIIKKKPKQIKGIFITHEHLDHIKGVDVFSRKYQVPVFATKKTMQNCFLCFDKSLLNPIKNNEIVSLCGMEIEAFSKSHSAIDPVSYSITNRKKLSILTDIGYCCNNITKNVFDSDFIFMESNHDITMLENGSYPYFLKNWIKSNEGHLSNMQSALCILEYASSRLKHIVLSHISKNNNTPLIALETFKILKERKDLQTKISVSLREFPTRVFKI